MERVCHPWTCRTSDHIGLGPPLLRVHGHSYPGNPQLGPLQGAGLQPKASEGPGSQPVPAPCYQPAIPLLLLQQDDLLASLQDVEAKEVSLGNGFGHTSCWLTSSTCPSCLSVYPFLLEVLSLLTHSGDTCSVVCLLPRG